MFGSCLRLTLISLVLSLAMPAVVLAQADPPPPPILASSQPTWSDAPVVCKIYQLRDVSENVEVRNWIMSTIPEMVRPGTWRQLTTACQQPVTETRIGSITYDSRTGLMAVRHVAAAHVEIEDFLKMVKSSVKEPACAERQLAAQSTGRAGPVMPAQFGVIEAAKADANNQGYPVPPPLQQPRHLFHFVIRFEGSGMDATLVDVARKLAAGDSDTREAVKEDGKPPFNQLLHFIVRYEGDGIIDANVVEFMKVYARMANQEKDKDGSDPLIGETHPKILVPTRPAQPGWSGSTPLTPTPAPAFPPPGGINFPASQHMPAPEGVPSLPGSPAPKPVPGVNLHLDQSRASPTTMPGIIQIGNSEGQPLRNQQLTLEEIVRMTRSGATAQVIINQINNTNSTFSLSTDDVNWLTLQGVPSAVVEHMQTRSGASGEPHSSPMGLRPSVETPAPSFDPRGN